MSFETIDRTTFRPFFDQMSRVLQGRPVDFEILGLELGDQQQSWLTLRGITYDSHDGALHVYAQGSPGQIASTQHLDHIISGVREVHVDIGDRGLAQLLVIDAEGHKQFVRFRNPLQLPESTS